MSVFRRRIIETILKSGGERMISGTFNAGSERDCSANPLTITHGLGKTPTIIAIIRVTLSTSQTNEIVNQIDYINIEGEQLKRYCRTSSKSSREALWSTLLLFNDNSFTVQSSILDGDYIWYVI